MRIVSNCTILAAALSASYRTYDDFRPGSSLEHFLEENGILLTMCMRYGGTMPWLECSRKEDDAKLSASWIQADKTRGFRVIGKPVDKGPPIGLVLKPTATSVRCIYPVDAGTVSRDDNGCGPWKDDPKYGSDRKMYDRQALIRYRDKHFGKIEASKVSHVPNFGKGIRVVVVNLKLSLGS